jgi:hypothetical protein
LKLNMNDLEKKVTARASQNDTKAKVRKVLQKLDSSKLYKQVAYLCAPSL